MEYYIKLYAGFSPLKYKKIACSIITMTHWQPASVFTLLIALYLLLLWPPLGVAFFISVLHLKSMYPIH